MRSATDRLDFVAFLAAICLFLASIEYVIPKPVPFMRIGLANLPILLALEILQIRYILLLILLKVLGQGLVHGTMFSYVFLFSLAGSFTSGLIMILLKKVFRSAISLIGLSIFGALASNIVQILLARVLVFGDSVWIIVPPFLIVGTVSSTILGIFARLYSEKSTWFRRLQGSAKTK